MLLELLDPCFALLLDVQAGGGGSFGGGGSSGGGGGFSGGGGGGGGFGFLIYLLIRLVVEHPLIGIPLVLVVLFVMHKGSRKGWARHQSNVIRGASGASVANRSKAWAAEVRAADPEFDEAAFLARVRTAFDKAQSSWCAQDLGPIQHFVTDGVYERFSLQIEEQREDHWRQGMEGVQVVGSRLVHFDGGRVFDTVTVRIEFSADIHRIHLETGKRIPGSQLPRNHFAECWSFVRRKGAKSRTEAGLIEGQCPNCGAPLEMNQNARCASCEAYVKSGAFDWVLAEITQASEWRPEREESLPGVVAYAAEDPGISVQLLEDRTSVAFWRKASADRKGSVEPLMRIADGDFTAGFTMNLEALQGGDRFYVAENAVGSVRTLGLLAGDTDDRAVVEVLSDGRRARIDDKGRHQIETARHLQRALYVFGRPAGQKTRVEESFSTAHCRSCGARDLGGTDPLCPYCEAPRSGDASAWSLREIVIDRTADAQDLRAELAAVARGAAPDVPERLDVPNDLTRRPGSALARVSSADLVAWAASLVQVDGRQDPRQRQALATLAERADLSDARLEELLHEGGDQSSIPEPRDTFEARLWLKALIELAFSDGEVSKAERRFLRRASEGFGVGRIEFETLLKRVRADLYREARQARRSS